MGENPRAALYAGMNIDAEHPAGHGGLGALAGLAGMSEVAGIAHQLQRNLSPGYGYAAIIVAWLARAPSCWRSWSGVPSLDCWSAAISCRSRIGLPAAIAPMLQGTILFFLLGGEILARYRLVRTKINMRHSSDGIGLDNVAIGIVRHEDGIVLVQQETNKDPIGYCQVGSWSLVSFIVNGLIREIREEVGVEVTEVGRLACLSQIDRPEHGIQAMFFILRSRHGLALPERRPDDEILSVELVRWADAINRLEANGGWLGVREPLLAYLRGETHAGGIWFYREDAEVQRLVAYLPG